MYLIDSKKAYSNYCEKGSAEKNYHYWLVFVSVFYIKYQKAKIISKAHDKDYQRTDAL